MGRYNMEFSRKRINIFIILTAFFVGNAIIAEFTGAKIFNLGAILGIGQIHLPFLSIPFDFNVSVGLIIWPLVFIISDLMNEYFGRGGVRKLSYLTAIIIAYGFVVLYFGTQAPPAQFWLENNIKDASGNTFDINYAYTAIFRQSMGIIVGSISAFLVSQLVDVYAFHYLRRLTGHKKLWLRATGSTVISQFIDSFVILFIAFYFLGNWTFDQVISVGIVQYTYKILMAVGLTPLIYIFHYFIDRYLGKDESSKLIEESDKNW
jgi:hypothetical protein